MDRHYINNKNSKIIVLIFSCFATILNFAIGITIIPYITEHISTEAYGFLSLTNNFVSYMSLLTLALNSYAVRHITVAYYENNMKKVEEYYYSVVLGNVYLCSFILVFAVVFTLKINYFLIISDSIIRDVQILFFLSFLNFCILTLANSFASSAYIADRLDVYNLIKVISYFIEILFFYFFFSKNILRVWYVNIAYIAQSMTLLLGNIYIMKHFTSEIKISKTLMFWKNIKILMGEGIWNSINGLGNILNSGLDLWVSNLLLDNVLMGNLAIAKVLGGIPCQINSAVSSIFHPQLLKYYAQGDKDRLVKKFKSSMKITGLFVNVLIVVFIVIGDDFLMLWIPKQNVKQIYLLSIITLICNSTEGIIAPLYYIYTLTIKNKIPCFVTIIGGGINILSMFFLIKNTRLGVYAVVLTTLVIMMIINLISNPLYGCYCLKVKWNTFYLEIIKYYLSLFTSSVILRIIKIWIVANTNWLKFFFLCMMFSIITTTVYIEIMMDKSEKKEIAKYIKIFSYKLKYLGNRH